MLQCPLMMTRLANVICTLLEIIKHIRQNIRIVQTTTTERKETGNKSRHLMNGLTRSIWYENRRKSKTCCMANL